MPTSLPQSSGSILVIIAIVCISIGYVFGWLIASMRARENKKEPEISTPVAPANPRGSTAVMKLWREPVQKKLLVDLDGQVFDQAGDLTAEQRKRVEGSLRETAGWLGLISQASAAASAKPATQNPAVKPVVVATTIPSTPARPPSVIAGMTGAIADVIQPVAKVEPQKSIVGQIDEIVQRMLIGTPYENEMIFLMEDPKRGVLVRVGAQTYEGIASVPEGEIKNLLKAAVAEWEKQQEISRRRAI